MQKWFINILIFIFFMCVLKNSYADDKKIIMQYQNRPPFFIEGLKPRKLVDGIGFHLVQKILKNANIPYVFENKPHLRALVEIKENKEPTCYVFAYKSEERETYALFSIPFHKTLRIVAVIRKNDSRFKNIKNIEQIMSNKKLKPILKIGYNSVARVEQLLKKYKNYSVYKNNEVKNNIIILTSETHEKLLLKLIKNEGDYTLITLDEFQYYKKNKEIKDNLVELKLSDLKNEIARHFMCSYLVGQDVINKINTAIKITLPYSIK